MPVTPRWEHFPHDADVGVRGVGATLAQAYEQAALALTAAIADLATVLPKQGYSFLVTRPMPSCCWSTG